MVISTKKIEEKTVQVISYLIITLCLVQSSCSSPEFTDDELKAAEAELVKFKHDRETERTNDEKTIQNLGGVTLVKEGLFSKCNKFERVYILNSTEINPAGAESIIRILGKWTREEAMQKVTCAGPVMASVSLYRNQKELVDYEGNWIALWTTDGSDTKGDYTVADWKFK